MTTIFSKIIKGEIPCDKVFENQRIIAFKDIYPKASIHFLICPKKEIADLQSLQEEDLPLVAEMIQVAQQLAKEYQIQDGYRLVVNNGPGAGQSVQHLHFHLMGGKKLGAMR
jgi:diadenosine tetraphosphate (Ap4A) HIT family hydrolase